MKQLIIMCMFLPGICISQIDQELSNSLYSELKTAVDQNLIEGISAAIVMPDESVWESSYGLATPSDSLTTDHHLFAGSTTKTFIAAAILQLEENGSLSINDSIGTYLKPFENVDGSITIKQLLNHTSGIFNYTDNPDLWNIINTDPTEKYTSDEIMTFVMEPEFVKGTAFGYSNSNYILLSIIIEQVSQEKLEDVLRSNFIDPLGLETMFLAGSEVAIGSYGGMWLDQDGNATPDDISWFPTTALTSGAWGAGAIATTPADLALWAKKLYGTNEILSGPSIAKMLQASDHNDSYGLGTSWFDFNSCEFVGHSGSIIHQTVMYYNYEHDFSIVMMYNGGEYNFLELLSMVDLVKNYLMIVDTKEPIVPSADITLFPNPFTDDLHFNFELLSNSNVKLELFSEDGRSIKVLINQDLLAGKHEYSWNGSFFDNLTKGVYHYQFRIDEEIIAGSLVKM